MGHVDDAAELKAVAKDFGLRVHELRAAHPTDTRFVVNLDRDLDSNKVYVHASPSRLIIALEGPEGKEKPLSYDEALEQFLSAIGA